MDFESTAHPQMEQDVFLTYVGMETDLIFSKGHDLPGFASYPLLETDAGRNTLRGYYQNFIDMGRQAGLGVILESATWVANRDRGAAIGYSPDALRQLNQDAIVLMADVAQANPDVVKVLSANVGPRADAYAPHELMSVDEATAYHLEQLTALSATSADVISGYTLAYPEEAIGITRAAKSLGLPVVVSFTVETDGHLPTGLPLGDAITQVDAQTDAYPLYYMINCAHPDHFSQTLQGQSWEHRLRGIVANASRCSHAELDEAEELDDGNPQELGRQLAGLHGRFPMITVLGGCCGTDMRHLSAIATALKEQR